MPDAASPDEIDHIVKDLERDLVTFRRALHRHPEVSRRETRTTARLIEKLTALGLHPRTLSCGTGLICDVGDDGSDAPRLGLRGDIDALPLDDRKDVSYRSEVAGACHACGHDVHTTILLGTASVLAELAGRGFSVPPVRLIFQPAEEVVPGGAEDVIADGELDGLRRVFAFHCDPRLEAGTVGLRPGPITAGADRVRVTLNGPGGHTARPHLTNDLVFAAGSVIAVLPGLLSRRYDPRAGLSLVWGQVHGGTAPNTIPQSLFVEGTLRCLDADVWRTATDEFEEVVRSFLVPFGVDADIEVVKSVPPCVNDPLATEEFRDLARVCLGDAGVVTMDQSLGGEDFAWMVERVPGSLIRLGVRSPGDHHAPDLHHGSFDADESAISVGVRLFARLAAQAL